MTTTQSQELDFTHLLDLRVQYELERIEHETDRVLLKLFDHEVYGLLEDRHHGRPQTTALDRVQKLAYDVSHAQIPVFIKTIPELADAWMRGKAYRAQDEEQKPWFEEEDPGYASWATWYR